VTQYNPLSSSKVIRGREGNIALYFLTITMLFVSSIDKHFEMYSPKAVDKYSEIEGVQ
jgi:hypothetical protein